MATTPTAVAVKANVPAKAFEPTIKAGTTVKAMTAAGVTGGTKGVPFEMPLAQIKVLDGFNVRVTGTPASEAAMDELVQSLLANGFYPSKPLAGFVADEEGGPVVYVKDGHRRLEAVERANALIEAANAVEGATARPLIETLPVIATPAGSLEDMTVEMAQSNTGAPLTMFEKGLLATRLLGYNMTKEDIAAKLSMTERHLNNVLLLASAPAKLRDLIVADQVTPTTGLKLMKDPKTAVAKATEMVKASAAKGKAKATPKDSQTKMQAATSTFEFKAGASIKDTLQSLAAFVRENIGHDAEDAITAALGSVKLTVSIPAPAPAPKPVKATKPAKAPTAAKTPAQAKAAAQAHLGTAPAAGEAPAPAGEDLSGL